jgi:hypothetical protein
MSGLGMSIATVNQCFPLPSTCLVLGSQLGQILFLDAQIQFGTHWFEGFTRLNTLQ